MSELIASAKGRFIRVDFHKVDGSERMMIVQPAKLKFEVKGDEASASAKQGVETRRARHPNLLPVWDVQKEGIRSINMDTVFKIVINGEVHNYEG